MTAADVPKADMHVHLEGTITPTMVQKLAKRNNVSVPAGLIEDGVFAWDDDGTAAGNLKGFVQAYDDATSVMKCAEDYTDITYDYLKRSADEGCIYAEIFISADHGKMAGLTYPEMLAAITRGYEKAKQETGIEMRLISTCVRHYGPEAALRVAKITHDNPHPLVTGFGMAGDENAHTAADFKPAYDAAALPFRTAHAGEAAGPESVRDVRDVLNIRRFGHMVRAIDDPLLVEEQKKIGAVPEVCVSSNICLKAFKDYAAHPLRKFFDLGLKVVLGSDDPAFFGTSIGREYEIAQKHFGFSDDELKKITRNAVEEAFVDDATRARLLARLDQDVQPSQKHAPAARG
ncbi:MAG: adenosine deaminase [Alphaproteobacteria bacterium]|nr:adenosine deaminase [Alphaproteobacteria bacterium]